MGAIGTLAISIAAIKGMTPHEHKGDSPPAIAAKAMATGWL